MANKIETLSASVAIKTSAERFYNFFKLNMSDLCKVFPQVYTEAQLLQGDEGNVGCCKKWNYIIGNIQPDFNCVLCFFFSFDGN